MKGPEDEDAIRAEFIAEPAAADHAPRSQHAPEVPPWLNVAL